MLAVGDTAPDFTVNTHEGKPLTLSSLRGHKVLLWFYPKADTPGCTIEGRGFCDQHSAFEKAGIVVLGVSFDGVDANAAFAKKFGFQYPLLCDTERKIGIVILANRGDVHPFEAARSTILPALSRMWVSGL